jgi:hypothetical protein
MHNLPIGKIGYWQFGIGLLLHLGFLAGLYLSDVSYANLQIPVDEYQYNIWQCNDVMTYVNPAKNYLATGVFGTGTTPDHFRTIGYPALLAFLMYFFGTYWLLVLQVFQALVFACIYPLLSATIRVLLPLHSERFIHFIFAVLCLSGVYFTRVPVVLTDTLFTGLFIAGFLWGLRWYISAQKSYLFLYLLGIGLAALIRPTLGLFPLLNLALGYWVAKKYGHPLRKTLLNSCLVSLALWGLVNISTLRNYQNHAFWAPSSVIGYNALEYLGKKILTMEHQTPVLDSVRAKIARTPSITAKTQMRKQTLMQSIVRYPGSTIKILLKNTLNVFLSNHLVSGIANYYDFEWKKFSNTCHAYRLSPVLAALTYFLMLCYALLWLLFAAKTMALLQTRDFETLLLLGLLMVMLILPAVLTGDGGSRFRLPFEHFLVIFGFSVLFKAQK